METEQGGDAAQTIGEKHNTRATAGIEAGFDFVD